LSKVEAAAGVTSPVGLAAMARAAERNAPMMNRQGVGNTLNALGRVKAAAGAMLAAGWAAMAREAKRNAPMMNAQEAANTLAAIANLPKAWEELSILAGEHLEAYYGKPRPGDYLIGTQDDALGVSAAQRKGSLRAAQINNASSG